MLFIILPWVYFSREIRQLREQVDLSEKSQAELNGRLALLQRKVEQVLVRKVSSLFFCPFFIFSLTGFFDILSIWMLTFFFLFFFLFLFFLFLFFSVFYFLSFCLLFLFPSFCLLLFVFVFLSFFIYSMLREW